MLQSLRDKAQGWIAWIIIGLIGITFVLFGTESIFKSTDHQTIAKVQGTTITVHELDSAYKRYLNQPGSESLTNLDPEKIKREILQSLIDEAILVNSATKLGLSVSASQINLTMESIPFFLKEGHFSPEAYTRFLMNTGYTDKSFLRYIRDTLVKHQLQQGVVQTAFALPTDVASLVTYMMQKRDLRYITIERASFEKDVSFKEEEIKKYYENHAKEFMIPEQIALEYVVLSLKDLMAQYQPSDDEIRAYYHENESLFNEPERIQVAQIFIAIPKDAGKKAIEQANAKIKEIQQKMKEGDSFESLAKTYSDDEQTKNNGGVLDWFSPGEMLPEFDKVAFSLKQKNDISQVRTEFGLHLIKLLDKQEANIRSFANVKDKIIERMKEEQAQEKLATQAEQLGELAYDQPDSLQPIIDKLGLKIQKTELFTKSTPPKETILQNPLVMASAFSSSVKDDKNNSDVLKLDMNNYLVLRVANQIPAKQLTLEQAKSDIVSRLKFEKSSALAQQSAHATYEAILKNKSNLEKIQTQYSWTDAKNITRSNNKLSSELIETVFSMPNPKGEGGDFKNISFDNGDAYIIWLMKIEDGNTNDLSSDVKANYENQLAKHYGELEYTLYATDLLKKAKVKKYLDRI